MPAAKTSRCSCASPAACRCRCSIRSWPPPISAWPVRWATRKLVKEVLDIDLPKDETRSDWLQRPLTEMQMRYAADDVQHLARVYLALDARLSEEKRAWLLEDGAELVANLCRESDPRGGLPRGQAGLAAASAATGGAPRTLRLARGAGTPAQPAAQPRAARTYPVAAGACLPKNKTDLAAIEDMHPRTVRQDGDFLIELIAQAARLPQSEWPEALPEPLPPEVTPLLKSLRAIGQREAETLGMAPELMLRKKILEALLKSGYPDGPYDCPIPSAAGAANAWARPCWTPWRAHETNLFRLQEPAQERDVPLRRQARGVEPRTRGPAGAVRRAATCLRPAAHPRAPTGPRGCRQGPGRTSRSRASTCRCRRAKKSTSSISRKSCCA